VTIDCPCEQISKLEVYQNQQQMMQTESHSGSRFRIAAAFNLIIYFISLLLILLQTLFGLFSPFMTSRYGNV